MTLIRKLFRNAEPRNIKKFELSHKEIYDKVELLKSLLEISEEELKEVIHGTREGKVISKWQAGWLTVVIGVLDSFDRAGRLPEQILNEYRVSTNKICYSKRNEMINNLQVLTKREEINSLNYFARETINYLTSTTH